ncbi:drug resistance transporter, EmrB/QacA subfamily [Streptoalloteichus tenebrarius]|uniref:Drug resistance transporter, EmrB/QacA subfamily n=1 Tax=Streptoalloteichus tenebrarius (strain ATCC 17920 / DSM 40477 / JCM 4838 / CBS 697.72 / NBRC 16177 / NCIMB 11028 / NRRL B-12390 / A12253. 1 / ISP 5477) TaxID=1933 RepID=A0ABT1HYL2_STRSD|nr:MFS transporter [Streptoalloteichus tenebrarius]MCP2260617.1 drug resistance transporter, EmrB/QacA subfamily [Streptoalloteichus tenebrarius]BFF01500.1 MFS transporter [Streptoalloteichus tenebrarius]
MTTTGPEVRWGTGRARGVLAATTLGSGMAMLDSTIVNVALPALGRELGASVSGLQWVLDGYLLTLAALILVGGAMGDRYGRRRVFRIGVVWFGVASALCGVAPSTEVLVVARALQGVGGALLTPGSLAILQSVFARGERATAIGAWSGLSGVATAVGPLVGGLLVQAWSWRLAFLVNLPVAALTWWLTARFVPETRDAGAEGRPDVLAAALCALGLAGLTGALVEAPVRGAGDPVVIGAGVVGVLALVWFGARQARGDRPTVPPSLFADRVFLLANLATFLVYGALGAVMVLLVVQLQVSLGYSPTAAGLAGLPITLLMLVLSARSGRLAERVGPRWQLVVGPLVIAVGLLLLRRVVPGGGYVDAVLPGVLVFGVGLATVVAPVTATVLAAAPDRYAGVASGVNNAVARTGTLLAVAVLPTVAGLGGADYTDPAAMTEGWRTALLVCAGLCVVAGLVASGVDNRVLASAAAKPEPAEHELAHPGECLCCGVEGPPTHLSPRGVER